MLALETIDEEFEGREVSITLIEQEEGNNGNGSENGLGNILKFIEENSIDSGITVMNHQHDHYLNGTPKRND